jgi:hypothetical protein
VKRTYQFRLDKEGGVQIIVQPRQFEGQWHYIMEGGHGGILVYGRESAKRIVDALNRDRKAQIAAEKTVKL